MNLVTITFMSVHTYLVFYDKLIKNMLLCSKPISHLKTDIKFLISYLIC